MVVAIAASGEVVVPPGRGQEFRALARARLTALTKDAERKLLCEPAAVAAITAALIDAVGDREDSLANFARFPNVERVRGNSCVQLARSLGTVREGGVLIDLPLAQTLIAKSVGSTRECRATCQTGCTCWRVGNSPHLPKRQSRGGESNP